MRRVVIATLLLLLAVSCVEESDEPVPYQVATQSIVNGTRDPQAVDLTDGEILAIGWLFSTGDAGSPFCTGTLVDPWVVATASHCTFGRRPTSIGFGIGVEPRSPVATFEVDEIWEHPTLDAALLVLGEDALEAVSELEVIAPNSDALDSSDIGTAVQAGGYGQTRDDSRTGRWFATVYISAIQSNLVVVDGRGEQGICFGDSGGPILDVNEDGDPILLGVESNGDATCVDEDRLTRVDQFYDWAEPVFDGGIPLGACGDLSERGRCEGDILVWCHNETVHSQNCSDDGLTCGFHERTGHVCVPDSGTDTDDEPDPTTDPDDPNVTESEPTAEQDSTDPESGCRQAQDGAANWFWVGLMGLLLAVRKRA